LETPEEETELLEDMLERVGVADDWDIIMVGDGSGSNHQHEAGWGCTVIERQGFKRWSTYGCMSRGTVNLAEMLAYLQPLSVLASRERLRRKKNKALPARFYQVHILTDSNYVKEVGASGKMSPRCNASFWRIFDDFQRQGLIITWHWIPRETVELNVFADRLSKAARILIKHSDVQESVETDLGWSVDDFNPSY